MFVPAQGEGGAFPAQARQGPAIAQRFWMSRAAFSLAWLLLRFSVLSDRQQTPVLLYLAAVLATCSRMEEDVDKTAPKGRSLPKIL